MIKITFTALLHFFVRGKIQSLQTNLFSSAALSGDLWALCPCVKWFFLQQQRAANDATMRTKKLSHRAVWCQEQRTSYAIAVL